MKGVIIGVIVFFLLFLFIPFLIKNLLFTIFYVSVFAIVLVFKLIKYFRKMSKFYISTDKLVGYKEGTVDTAVGHFPNPFVLEFASFGRYQLETYNYTWSKTHKMGIEGLFYSSSIGDEFYIVSFDQKEPIHIYNKKLFELK